MMKKLLTIFLVVAGFVANCNAQLPDGSVFPDFTLTSITGQSLHLYSLLNSGYTVIIDVSATWCPPCWAYHQAHHLDSLYEQHGPAGWPGVSSTTTNNVIVIFVQGEETSHLAELYGNVAAGAILYAGTEIPYSQVTQGNWVAGTSYPIVDDTTSADPLTGTMALKTAWQTYSYPAIFMICRDHLIHTIGQLSAEEAYAASQADCPGYAASATVDAKAVAYKGRNYFVCNPNPIVSFQNYSYSNPITSASIVISDATGATVATQPWTGSLAPFEIADVPMTAFPGTTFGGYKYTVNVAGDSHPANNSSMDSVFRVYSASNASGLPAFENFSGSIPYKEVLSGGSIFPAYHTSPAVIGPNGSPDTALVFEFRQQSAGGKDEYVFGNFNTNGATGLTLSFDVSYAQLSSSINDSLAVEVSTDCGLTWSAPWSKAGATLATAPVDGTSEFLPGASSQWKHLTVAMHSFANANMVIKFVGTSQFGNNAYLDNIRLSNSTSVAALSVPDAVSIVPNPAKKSAVVNILLDSETDVAVQVFDVVGHMVSSVVTRLFSGNRQIELSVDGLASGLYDIKIIAGNSVITKKLSVIQ